MRKETLLMEDWKFRMDGEEQEARSVDLPHDWVLDAPYVHRPEDSSQGFHTLPGTGWYEKTIAVQAESGRRYFLDFGGIYEKSTVYVNGKEVGGRDYGYSSFRLEVTDALVSGPNTVRIRVAHNIFPTDRWYSGAGIYRTVKLVETGELILDESEIIVRTVWEPENGSARIRVSGWENGIRVTGTLSALPRSSAETEEGTGTEAAGCEEAGSACGASEAGASEAPQQEALQDEDGELNFCLEEPRLWSAENPNLYLLTLTRWENDRPADAVSMRIGIRDVRIDPEEGLRINGEPVKLHGVCLHQDAGAVGIAVRKEMMRARLLRLKEIGVNAIRAAHHIYAPEFLDLCDELGFYVYEECFDKWTGGHYGSLFEQNWKKDVDCMVKRDRNRPSIILWGVGNEVENQGQDSMLRILEMLVDRVKVLDASRPVTCAMNPHFKRESNVDVSQIQDIQQFVDESDDTEIYDLDEKIARICRIAQKVDLLACNYQEQWYERIHAAVPDKAILGTEVYQYFAGHPDQFKNFTEDIPSFIPERYPYVIGSMIWTGVDYLGETTGWPMKTANGGCIRTNLERKPMSYILQSRWTSRPMVHFSVLDYTVEDEGVKDHWDAPPYIDHWDFPQFQRGLLPYLIVTNCEEVELYINGMRIYVDTPEHFHNGLIRGFLKWEPGTVTVIGKSHGIEQCRETLRTPGPAVQLQFDRKEGEAPAEHGYQELLTVRAKDAEGIPCLRESARVRFRVEGPAVIVAVDNGDSRSMEPYHADSRHLFRGQASVIVAMTGAPGRVVVYADADGMQTASTSFDVL